MGRSKEGGPLSRASALYREFSFLIWRETKNLNDCRYDMTNEQLLKAAIENNKRLEKRVAQLEEEMLTCLAFMRKHAQRMAGIKGENHEA